jgi:hypothetical protein
MILDRDFCLAFNRVILEETIVRLLVCLAQLICDSMTSSSNRNFYKLSLNEGEVIHMAFAFHENNDGI